MIDATVGWGKDGMYRIAHERAIKKSYARCITKQEEDNLYRKNFQEEINKFIAQGVKYEDLKSRGREERRIAREKKFKLEEEEKERQAAIDAEIGALLNAHYDGKSTPTHVDSK